MTYRENMRRVRLISPASATLTALLLAGALAVTGCAGTSPDIASSAGVTTSPATVDPASCPVLPDGFAYLNTVDGSISVDLKYASTDNFTGEAVDGYERAGTAVLRADAAEALSDVQASLAEKGLGLLVFDAFRPTRAVADFVAWSHTDDDRTREEYYPTFEKEQLFELGYIAEQSGHSLGGTVDLTLVSLASGDPLDMGGTFDLFDERSHYEFDGITPQQFQNRTVLREAMIDAGFAPYPQEWWHFSYPVPKGAERLDFALESCG